MDFVKNILNKVKGDLTWRAGQEVSNKVNKGVSIILNKDKKQFNKCLKCKKEISDSNIKFCQNCGYKLIVTCRKCNLNFLIATKFCSECGNSLK